MGAHRSWVHIVRGCASVMGMHHAWAHMGRGCIWVVGGVIVGHGNSSWVGEGLSCPWALVIHGGGSLLSMGGALSSVGGGEGGRHGPWALLLGCRLWALGVARVRWVPLWALGIICHFSHPF